MKYIDADKIRAEIERRMETCDANSKTPNQLLWAELSALLPFLDTLSEEPDNDLEEAADNHIRNVVDTAGHPGWDWTTQDIADAFKSGAEWQEKRWENNRLMAQENATEEECQREMDFVDNHIKKNHRIPTFSDAINYGIEWHQKQMPLPEDTLIYQKGVKEGKRLMMEEAVEGEVIKTDKHTSIRYKSFYGTDRYFYGIADKQFKAGDKVRIIILPNEDEE